MSGRAKLTAKTSHSEKQNPFPHAAKTNSSPSNNSPFDQILFLQRTVGNRAVEGLLKSGVIQAKLTIGRPGDIYEQEADRVAEQVMRMSHPGNVERNGVSRDNKFPCIQRVCMGCEEDEGLTEAKPVSGQITPLFQRQVEPGEEEEEPLQTKEISGGTPAVTPSLESQIDSVRGRGQPLSESVRAFFEPRFGQDFSQVRVHTDSRAAESVRAVNGLAYTVGNDLVFGHGSFDPRSTPGRILIVHELAHVVQQHGSSNTIQRYDWGLHDVPGMAEWAESRHERSPRRDITVVDWGENWNGFNVAAGLFRVGEIDASSVEDMVEDIENSLQEGDCINSLTIIGHGSPGQISVGDGTGRVAGRYIGGGTLDAASPAYSPEMVLTLARLTPRFCDGALVTLRGCDVGNGDLGQMFVQRLVELWGVRVRAHVGTVRGGGRWTTGEWTEAEPGE